MMGVPISYFTKHDPNQFEILGLSKRGVTFSAEVTKTYEDYQRVKPNGEPAGGTGKNIGDTPVLKGKDGKKIYYINHETGDIVQPCFLRVFIRRK